jgi:hypothetical protein
MSKILTCFCRSLDAYFLYLFALRAARFASFFILFLWSTNSWDKPIKDRLMGHFALSGSYRTLKNTSFITMNKFRRIFTYLDLSQILNTSKYPQLKIDLVQVLYVPKGGAKPCQQMKFPGFL